MQIVMGAGPHDLFLHTSCLISSSQLLDILMVSALAKSAEVIHFGFAVILQNPCAEL